MNTSRSACKHWGNAWWTTLVVGVCSSFRITLGLTQIATWKASLLLRLYPSMPFSPVNYLPRQSLGFLPLPSQTAQQTLNNSKFRYVRVSSHNRTLKASVKTTSTTHYHSWILVWAYWVVNLCSRTDLLARYSIHYELFLKTETEQKKLRTMCKVVNEYKK